MEKMTRVGGGAGRGPGRGAARGAAPGLVLGNNLVIAPAACCDRLNGITPKRSRRRRPTAADGHLEKPHTWKKRERAHTRNDKNPRQSPTQKKHGFETEISTEAESRDRIAGDPKSSVDKRPASSISEKKTPRPRDAAAGDTAALATMSFGRRPRTRRPARRRLSLTVHDSDLSMTAKLYISHRSCFDQEKICINIFASPPRSLRGAPAPIPGRLV
ncbi:hypothetical protein EVAR_32495_1 [Eumeta japonica]|uniref:Uncharacterized protein n=1 Tax=Eumeta variegata TaxID=151549 RepID=A0A4C1W6H3_EUMVA|nr:hypothetical protein EVAR_32495_1 [Eumeta japonica]